MPITITAAEHVAVARGLVRSALPSLEWLVSSKADPIIVEQQAPWVIGELEHAAKRLRAAITATEAEAILAVPMQEAA